jgi:hypothetical protein
MNLSERNEYRKVTIASIVFLQGDDYIQYEKDNPADDLEYLLQWYQDSDSHYEQDDYSAGDINTPFLGKLIKIDGYKGYFLFSKNTRIGYMGLARLIEILK